MVHAGFKIKGAAALLRYMLVIQLRYFLQRRPDGISLRPFFLDLTLQRLNRFQAMAVNDRGAHIRNNEIRHRNKRVAQQRQYRLQPSSGDKDQLHIRASFYQSI
ncbi:hypothetical protein D3C71_1145040 [compost metagenome]